jgi:transposase
LTRTRREILEAHRKCVTTTTRLRNRLKSYLSDHGVRLPRAFRLTDDKTLQRIAALHPWQPIQLILLRQIIEELQAAEARRKELRATMAKEVLSDPSMLKLVRLMGVRHIVAFALVAIIGDINRFQNHKKLVAYIGLTPSINDSGETIRGRRALSRHGRSDLRALLIQSAHNALQQPASPLHKWGWKLVLRKAKNVAVAAVARKLTVAVWYLMRGLFTPMQEIGPTLQVKLSKLASEVGLKTIKEMGYRTKREFLEEKHRILLQTT